MDDANGVVLVGTPVYRRVVSIVGLLVRRSAFRVEIVVLEKVGGGGSRCSAADSGFRSSTYFLSFRWLRWLVRGAHVDATGNRRERGS